MRALEIGESFVGSGPEAAHINTVLGPRSGPAGTAWATALATPTAGHAPFVAVVRPGLPAKPLTLFVNNRAATRAALESGRRALPALDDVLEARHAPENPFFRPGERGSR